MSGEVSARPANLQTYVTEAGELRTQLAGRMTTLTESYNTFQQGGYEYGAANPSLMGTGLPALLTRYSENETFVALVRQAFLDADSNPHDGVAESDATTLDAAFKKAAEAQGLDPEALTNSRRPISVDDPAAWGQPETAGFVNDPVSAATGHFLEVEDDIVVPPRLAVLAWRRTYTSRNPAAGPHGRGWASWASARCAVLDGGALAYQGPDGQMAIVAPGRDRVPGLLGSFRRQPDGVEVTWDQGSRYPGQRWHFAVDGCVRNVWGPELGSTAFSYEDGRLARLRHDGGRELALEWAGERVAAIHVSDGRSVRFTYDEAGDLVATDRATDPRRYTLDDAGRIVEVHDADGVRLCRNTYDGEGRVLTQVSPFGRETTFTYLPGRRTVVADTTGGPVSSFEHDDWGRLVALTNDQGETYRRQFDAQGRCSRETRFDGVAIETSYDDAGHLSQVDDPDGSLVTTFTWDDIGRLASVAGPGRPDLEFAYPPGDGAVPARIQGPEGWWVEIESEDGLLTRVTDADGVSVTMTYDADGCLTSSTNGVGATTRLRAHASGQVAEVIGADGVNVECAVDDAGRVGGIRLPNGDVWTIEHSPAGRVVAVVEPDGTRSTMQYGDHGGLERMVDAIGAVVELRYDQLERLVGVVAPGGAKWEYEHTALGMVSMVSDPTGAAWLYDYDAEGRLTVATDPLGAQVRRVHDAVGRLSETVDRNGQTTRFVRDELGRLVGQIEADGAELTLRRDAWGRPTEVVGADGHVVRYHYTPAGRLHSLRTGVGRTWTFTYDDAGRLAAVSDPTGATTRYEWDACDRPVALHTASGRTTRTEYDALGRAVAFEEGGVRWTADYDHAGRIVARTDPLGATTRFGYDRRGKLVSATDPLGNTTKLRWDERGDLVAVVDPLGGVTTTVYDAMRRPVAVTDAVGRTTSWRRDRVGRVREEVRADGSLVTYRRDRRGLVTDVVVDGRDVVVYERDRRGRPILVHEPGPNRTHALRWSPGGRLVELDTDGRRWRWEHAEDGVRARTDPSGRLVEYERDGAGRLVGMRSGRWGEVRLDRDADGRVVAVVTDGLERRWSHDEGGRLAGYDERLGSATTSTVIERDAAGRIVAAVVDDATIRYRYDAAGQLVAATGADGAWSWRYDAGGRLVLEEGPAGARTFVHDEAHQLVRCETSTDDTTTFSYDDVGRRVAEEHRDGRLVRYGWDPLGRLASIDRDGSERRLDVDAFGALAGMDGLGLDWDVSGGVAALTTLGKQEMVGLPGLHLGVADDDGVRWAHADWRGSTVPTDPWGRDGGGGGDGGATAPGAFGELDLDGLLWLRNRVYDPSTRAFLSPDPLPGISGQPVATNPYHYAANDPIGAVDPLGLTPVSIEQYNAIRDQVTGIRWGNIAMVALTAASFFIPGGPLVMLAVGAAMGAAPGIINGVQTGNWDVGSIVKGAVIGGVAGAAGGAIGGRIASSLVNSGSRFANPAFAGAVSGAVTGGGGAALGEAYDVVPGLPGADGSFDPEAVLAGSVAGGITGPLGARALGSRRTPAQDPELFYRGMSTDELNFINGNAGRLYPKHGESFVTQDADYVRHLRAQQAGTPRENNYNHLVEYQVQPGTRQTLINNGARNDAGLLDRAGLGDLPPMTKGRPDLVHIKGEGDSINYGLRRESVDLFNNGIIDYREIPW